MKRLGLIVAVLGMSYLTACSPSELSVTTQRYDNARTGQNLSETILNTSNVNPVGFGKLFTRAVDDEIYAQPLYVSSVSIPKVGVRNVLYVATVNNTVYAFDADRPDAGEPLWKVNLTDTVPGVTPVKARDVGHLCGAYRDITENIGIVGTPVIHPGRQTITLSRVPRNAINLCSVSTRWTSPPERLDRTARSSSRPAPKGLAAARRTANSTSIHRFKSKSGATARQRACRRGVGLSLRYRVIPWMDHGL